LPFIGAALRLLGFRGTRDLLERFSPAHPTPSRPYSADLAEDAQRSARLVGIAARHRPYRATCLRQSLALWWLLRRRGISTELRIGVRMDSGALRAHAWVEFCGRPLGQQTLGFSAFQDSCSTAEIS
jgi:hypothetical protein